MSSPTSNSFPIENRLLASLAPEELARLKPGMEMVHLPQSKIVYFPGDHVRYAYFPNDGMFSLLSTTEDGATVEVSMVGNEGLIGLPVILQMNLMPYEVMIQITSDAVRIRGDLVKKEFDQGGNFQKFVLRYTHLLLTQISQSSVCNHFHPVGKRLCRWLLIAQDRVKSDTLTLTQEIISHMLGIPRTGVTMAAGELQRAGLIRYSRGKIVILNREELEAASCECYRIVREEFERFFKGV
jgi:CRP-like cAMP-binding protein